MLLADFLEGDAREGVTSSEGGVDELSEHVDVGFFCG